MELKDLILKNRSYRRFFEDHEISLTFCADWLTWQGFRRLAEIFSH